MEKLSGLILDAQDEEGVAKLSSAQLDMLPDDVFAVVLRNGDITLRKYAMANRATVQDSTAAFLKHGHKLPPSAQKVAAIRLYQSHDDFELEPPEELAKLALGVGAALSAAVGIPGVLRETKGNLNAAKGAGSAIMTPQQMKQQSLQNTLGGLHGRT